MKKEPLPDVLLPDTFPPFPVHLKMSLSLPVLRLSFVFFLFVFPPEVFLVVLLAGFSCARVNRISFPWVPLAGTQISPPVGTWYGQIPGECLFH